MSREYFGPLRALILVLAAAWFLAASPCTAFGADPSVSESVASGEAIYQSQCARCHGANGEGVADEYPTPLQGEHSLEELRQIIHDSMPADDPEACTGDDARRVAEYIHQTFYARGEKADADAARIELVRLTVRQYLNAATDLVASFGGEATISDQRGLEGKYFNARGFNRDKRVLERIDPRVAFHFGEGSPDAAIGPEEFSMQWRGGVIAEETGDYEFCVKTDNAARLWVNGDDRLLIDAWVRSGDAIEHRGTIRLLGGRVYPIRLEYFKSKEPTASIELCWRPPHRAEEVIPQRNLTPGWYPPLLVVETSFPPDDSSAGYERGTAVSAEWEQATTHAALEIADKVLENLERLAQCKADDADRPQKLKAFCHRFAERAFRRPLTDEQKRFFVDSRFESQQELDVAVKTVVLLTLTSPRFLYLGIGGNEPDGYEVATRLSFSLWDSLPDDALLRAAAEGKLRTADEVSAQAERMLSNGRAKAKLRAFLHQWLKVRPADEITKDRELYPGFDETVASDLRTSLDLLLDSIVWSDPSDFRQLLLADYGFFNERLAKFYQLSAPKGDGFHRVALDPARQAGIMTHPYLMADHAYYKSTSPIHRGVFIVRSVLGRPLRPPPVAVAPLDEGFDPNMTTRERVAFQTRPAACQTCHDLINPFGFSLEHFDAVGRIRTEEKSQPIDASGAYTTGSGELMRFNGGRELAEILAQSDEVHASFVAQLFHYTAKQPIHAYGPSAWQNLTAAFAANDYSIRRLLVEIMRTSALVTSQRP